MANLKVPCVLDVNSWYMEWKKILLEAIRAVPARDSERVTVYLEMSWSNIEPISAVAQFPKLRLIASAMVPDNVNRFPCPPLVFWMVSSCSGSLPSLSFAVFKRSSNFFFWISNRRSFCLKQALARATVSSFLLVFISLADAASCSSLWKQPNQQKWKKAPKTMSQNHNTWYYQVWTVPPAYVFPSTKHSQNKNLYFFCHGWCS